MDNAEILERLDKTLLSAWRAFLTSTDDDTDDSFRRGVDACAQQLERTIAAIREEIANG